MTQSELSQELKEVVFEKFLDTSDELARDSSVSILRDNDEKERDTCINHRFVSRPGSTGITKILCYDDTESNDLLDVHKNDTTFFDDTLPPLHHVMMTGFKKRDFETYHLNGQSDGTHNLVGDEQIILNALYE